MPATRRAAAAEKEVAVLVSTVPTSVTGLDVMPEYIRDDQIARATLDDPEYMIALLTTIKSAVANLVGGGIA